MTGNQVHGRLCTKARQCAESVAGGHRQLLGARTGDNRAADRVFGSLFEGRRRRKNTRAGDAPRTANTSDTESRPDVSVPVLSNATHVMRPSCSRCAPPLINTPERAAAVNAETMDTGVEITSAHGHATTSSVMARYTQVENS